MTPRVTTTFDPATAGPAVYFYARGGQANGPVDLDTLRHWAATGALLGDDLVWADGDANSAPAGQVPALAGAFAAAAPAPAWSAAADGTPYGQPLSYHTPQLPAVAYAGFWRRFAAFVVDYICAYVLQLAVGGVLIVVIRLALAGGGTSRQDVALVAGLVHAVVGLTVVWLYYALFESSRLRATPGKLALGIVVVDAAGSRIGFGRATARYFAKFLSYLIAFVGFMMAGWTQRKQALHDLIADTLVVVK